jgi:hypothetical protein
MSDPFAGCCFLVSTAAGCIVVILERALCYAPSTAVNADTSCLAQELTEPRPAPRRTVWEAPVEQTAFRACPRNPGNGACSFGCCCFRMLLIQTDHDRGLQLCECSPASSQGSIGAPATAAKATSHRAYIHRMALSTVEDAPGKRAALDDRDDSTSLTKPPESCGARPPRRDRQQRCSFKNPAKTATR